MMSPTKWNSGNADKPGVYFDEENRRHLNSIRSAYASAALNLASHDKKDQARKLLERCDQMMDQGNFPYGMVSRFQEHNSISMGMLQACYFSDDTVLAKKIIKSLKKDLEQQLNYYANLDASQQDAFDYVVDSRGRKGGDKNEAEDLLAQIQMLEAEMFGGKKKDVQGVIQTPPIDTTVKKAEAPKKPDSNKPKTK